MKVFFLVLAFMAILSLASFPEEDSVLVLTDATFDEALKQYEFLLVKFYAPWCGHCKSMAPEFAAAAAALKSSDKSIALAKVDATVEKASASRHGVNGYPTLKFFVKGEAVDYKGGRVEKDIISWITKNTGDVTTELKSKEDFENFNANNQVTLIYFGTSAEDANYSTFKTVAMGQDSIAFATVFDPSIAAGIEVPESKLVMFKHFDEKRNDFTGEFTVSIINEFINKYSYATIMEFSSRAIEKIFQNQNPAILLFQDDSELSTAAREEFNAAGQKLKGGKLIFSVTSPNDGHGHWIKLSEYLGVDITKVPIVMILDVKNEMGKYKLNQKITKDNLVSFTEKFLSNPSSLDKFDKSEDIPTNNDGPVKILVGKTWKKEVITNSNDVLVMFHAPWCGHCKQLSPEWEKAAEALKSNSKIVIAKIDATANEIPGISVESFPTLKFFKNQEKSKPVEYSGDRDATGIINFLKENTSHPWVEAAEIKKDDL